MKLSSSLQIKLGAILSYGTVLFNILCGLLYIPWMINVIGKEDYGLYILITSFLHYFVVDFGIWMAVNKILSKLRAENRIEEEKNVIGIATKIYLCLDIVVCCAVVIAYFFIDDLFTQLTHEEIEKFKIAYLIAAFFSVLSFPFGFVKGIFSAHEFFVQTKIYDFVTKLGTILLTVILLSFGLGLYSLVFVYGLVPFIVNISRVLFLHKKGIESNLSYNNRTVVKSIFSLSFWLFLIVLAELFINNISPSLLARYSNSSEIAIFGIGLTLSQYVIMFASAINGLFLPRVTQLYVEKKNEELHNLTYKIGRLQLLITGFLGVGVVLVGGSFIESWVGTDFHNAHLVAILLILPQIIINMQQIETTQLLAADKLKYKSISMILTAIASVTVSVLLIPRLGALGSAWAICVSNTLFMIILLNFYFVKYLDFQIRQYIKNISPLFISYILVVVGYFAISKYVTIHIGGWVKVITEAILYSMLFCIFTYPMCNKYEKSLLRQSIKKITRR